MKLFVIRHGHTTGDAEDRYGGAYDDHLSDEGEAQAAELAKELAGRGIERVYCSSLIRAQETAGVLAEACGCDVVVEPEFRERNQYGALTGMVKAEARRDYPELVEKLKDRMFTAEGAESYTDFSERVAAAFADVTGEPLPCAAIVWHGGGMRVLFRDILKMGELSEIGDCCWVELVRDGDGFKPGEYRRIKFGF